MFAGHVGAAFAIARVGRRVNVGAFVLAALLLDVVLWLFVLVAWETVMASTSLATIVILCALVGWPAKRAKG